MERLFVVKIGGNVIDSNDALDAFLFNLATAASDKSSKFILIHGGGKIATKIGDQLGIESKYMNGRRITNDETIDVVTMVYGGLVNKKIVAKLQRNGCNAIGLTGADGNIIPAHKRPVKEIDFGWVGDINTAEINTDLLLKLLQADLVPVFAPLTHDSDGHILNTNADTIASVLAMALSPHFKVRLVYCFEKAGVLEDVNDDDSVIRNINKETYTQLLREDKLFEGIIPKIDNAFAAIEKGVSEVLIGHSNDLLANVTDKTTGTLFEA